MCPKPCWGIVSKKNRTSLSTGETRTLLLHLFCQKPDPGLVKAQSCISGSPGIYLKWSQKGKVYYKRTNPPGGDWGCIAYIVIPHATHVLTLIQIVPPHAEVYLITLARVAMGTGGVVGDTLMTGSWVEVNLTPWGFGVARPLNELQGVLA